MNGSNHTIGPKCGCSPFKVGDLLIYRETDLHGNTVIYNGNVVIHCYDCSGSYEMDAETLLNLIGVLDKELNHARPIRRFWRCCLYKCESSCRKLIEKIEHSGVICALRGNHRWCMTHEGEICFNCRKLNYGTEIQT